MARRSPKGVLSRLPPDWYGSKSIGFHIVQNSVAGQNSYVGVFNQSPDESFYVYGVNTGLSANSYVFMEVIPGLPAIAAAFNDGGNIGLTYIDPRYGQPSLLAWSGSIAQCIGFHVNGFSSNNTASIFTDYPLMIAPPGYSAMLQVRSLTITIEATIFGTMIRGG